MTGSRLELRQKHPFDRDGLRMRDVAISESGHRVAAATDVGLAVWDAATGNVAASFKVKDSHCSRIVFADESSLVVAHHDATDAGVAIVKWRFSRSGLEPIGVVWQQFDRVWISPLGRTVCWALPNNAGRPRTMKLGRIHWEAKQ